MVFRLQWDVGDLNLQRALYREWLRISELGAAVYLLLPPTSTQIALIAELMRPSVIITVTSCGVDDVAACHACRSMHGPDRPIAALIKVGSTMWNCQFVCFASLWSSWNDRLHADVLSRENCVPDTSTWRPKFANFFSKGYSFSQKLKVPDQSSERKPETATQLELLGNHFE